MVGIREYQNAKQHFCAAFCTDINGRFGRSKFVELGIIFKV